MEEVARGGDSATRAGRGAAARPEGQTRATDEGGARAATEVENRRRRAREDATSDDEENPGGGTGDNGALVAEEAATRRPAARDRREGSARPRPSAVARNETTVGRAVGQASPVGANGGGRPARRRRSEEVSLDREGVWAADANGQGAGRGLEGGSGEGHDRDDGHATRHGWLEEHGQAEAVDLGYGGVGGHAPYQAGRPPARRPDSPEDPWVEPRERGDDRWREAEAPRYPLWGVAQSITRSQEVF